MLGILGGMEMERKRGSNSMVGLLVGLWINTSSGRKRGQVEGKNVKNLLNYNQ